MTYSCGGQVASLELGESVQQGLVHIAMADAGDVSVLTEAEEVSSAVVGERHGGDCVWLCEVMPAAATCWKTPRASLRVSRSPWTTAVDICTCVCRVIYMCMYACRYDVCMMAMRDSHDSTRDRQFHNTVDRDGEEGS